MITDVEKTIREYLPAVIHMSLATSRDNKSWVCEVHYVYDDNLSLYFISLPTRRHSEDIKANKYVAGNIVKQFGVGEKPRGVYFEGTAEILTDVNADHPIFKLYCERLSRDSSALLEEIRKPDGHRFYKISVATYYLFDAQDSNPSTKYELKWGT